MEIKVYHTRIPVIDEDDFGNEYISLIEIEDHIVCEDVYDYFFNWVPVKIPNYHHCISNLIYRAGVIE
jgi:hypothetical protein